MFLAVTLPTPDATTCTGGQVSLCGAVEQVTGSERAGQWTAWVLDVPVRILLLIVLALVVRRVLHGVISRLATRIAEGPSRGVESVQERLPRGSATVSVRRAQRAQTVASVLRSVATAATFTIVGVMVLDELGFPVAPLLASAGVVGVALGFGAQSLVKDVVTGLFLIVEDQYGVGDVVDAGAATGTIEAVGLRVTRLRDAEGTVWYVRNGEILRVGNRSQGWSRVVMDVGLAPGTDLAAAQEQLRTVAAGLREDPDLEGFVLGDPHVHGIASFTADAVVLRVELRTAALRHDAVAAALRAQIHAHLSGVVSTADGVPSAEASAD